MGAERIPGWSVIIASYNYFFDAMNMAGIYLNLFLGSLTAGISYLVFRNFKCAPWVQVVHALFWIFSVKHIVWSRAGETNISSLFAVSLFWLLCFEFWKKPNVMKVLGLSVISTIALSLRIENGLLFIILIYVFWSRRETIAISKTFPALLIPLVLIKPIINSIEFYSAYNWTQLGTQGEEHTVNFSIINVIPNVYHYWVNLFEILNSPVLWFLFLIGGWKSFRTQREYIISVFLFLTMYSCAYFSGWLKHMGPDKVFIIFLPFLFSLSASGLNAIAQAFSKSGEKTRERLAYTGLIIGLIFVELLPEERGYFVTVVALYAAFEWIREQKNWNLPVPKYALVVPTFVIIIAFGFSSDFKNVELINDDEKILMTQLPKQIKNEVLGDQVLYVQSEDSANFIPGLKVRSAKSLLQAGHIKENEKEFYLQDIACSKTKVWFERNHGNDCDQVLARVPMTVVKTFHYGTASFILYRLN